MENAIVAIWSLCWFRNMAIGQIDLDEVHAKLGE
jgi:hypothetical protein